MEKHTITVVFENTDSIKFVTNENSLEPFIHLAGITHSITVSPFNGILDATTAKFAYLNLTKETLASPHSEFYNNGWVKSKDTLEYDAWEMLKTYKGISAIIIDEKTNDTDEMIYVLWDEQSEGYNALQHVEISDDDKQVVITIAEDYDSEEVHDNFIN